MTYGAILNQIVALGPNENAELRRFLPLDAAC